MPFGRGSDPTDINPLVRIVAVALAHKERPVLLRLRAGSDRAYGGVVGVHIDNKFRAEGVVPRWSQLVAQAELERKLRCELDVVVDVGGLNVALVIGLRDLYRIRR